MLRVILAGLQVGSSLNHRIKQIVFYPKTTFRANVCATCFRPCFDLYTGAIVDTLTTFTKYTPLRSHVIPLRPSVHVHLPTNFLHMSKSPEGRIAQGDEPPWTGFASRKVRVVRFNTSCFVACSGIVRDFPWALLHTHSQRGKTAVLRLFLDKNHSFICRIRNGFRAFKSSTLSGKRKLFSSMRKRLNPSEDADWKCVCVSKKISCPPLLSHLSETV